MDTTINGFSLETVQRMEKIATQFVRDTKGLQTEAILYLLNSMTVSMVAALVAMVDADKTAIGREHATSLMEGLFDGMRAQLNHVLTDEHLAETRAKVFAGEVHV